MALKIITGNLLDMASNGDFDVIVHGCNCQNTMGSGIAKQVKERFPNSWAADQQTKKGSIEKLGNWSVNWEQPNPGAFYLVNAYTQYEYNKPGERKQHFNYTAFALILEKFSLVFKSYRMGFPLIGAGLAGGNRSIILGMLEGFSEKMTKDVIVVEYDGS